MEVFKKSSIIFDILAPFQRIKNSDIIIVAFFEKGEEGAGASEGSEGLLTELEQLDAKLSALEIPVVKSMDSEVRAEFGISEPTAVVAFRDVHARELKKSSN